MTYTLYATLGQILLAADAHSLQAFSRQGLRDIAGREHDGSDAELRAAAHVLAWLMSELYDADICKDVGACVEIVLRRLIKLDQLPAMKELVAG